MTARERVAHALFRTAGAVYSLAERVERSVPMCPDCLAYPDRGEDVPCPVCEEARAQRDVEASIADGAYGQGYEQARRDLEVSA